MAWVGGEIAEQVAIETRDGRIAAITPASERRNGSEDLPGITIPGLANVHSHAFHRALRGRTHGGGGDFWSWRSQMYELAARLEPASYFELARDTYREMVAAGITAVGEFHYLHHRPGGAPYDDPNAMGWALIAAAAEAGLRLTLIDACYLQAGVDGGELDGAQLRFGDAGVAGWSRRVSALEPAERVRIGTAIHSVRAVDPEAMELVAAWAADRGAVLHVHLSEQPAENEACLEATGLTPAELLARAGALGANTTAVHAIHLEDEDVRLLGDGSTNVCLCPTTERDLGDGVAPAPELVGAGARLCFGTDSNAVIDLFEEARAAELDLRLTRGKRGILSPALLVEAATANGMRALGWPEAGRLIPGATADFCTVSTDGPRLRGVTPDTALGHLVFAASAADVSHVVVGGRVVKEP